MPSSRKSFRFKNEGLKVAKLVEDLEKSALTLIKNSKDGLLQSDLWKMLGLDSREGSRLVIRLAKKGLIRREQVMVNGRRTYRLYLVESDSSAKRILVDLTSILDIPCTTCPYIESCGPGNFYDPATCPLMDSWLEAKLENRSRLERMSLRY
ncbi:MAG: Lrp/AsnC family transcriptional regulator [Desulfurococcales archaeon]|nr:Lrp/AsnC family transcriptional regulator [Desulfurococcales archaeon]